jgi:hypothetical protein
MGGNSKYMVHLLGAVSSKHLFAIVFVGVSSFFAFLMVMSYRKSVQRNFRSRRDTPITPTLVDARRLESADGSRPRTEKKLGR